MIRNRTIVAITIAVAIAACSGSEGNNKDEQSAYAGPKVKAPVEADIRAELAYAANALLNNGTPLPGLAEAQIVEIEHERGQPVAIVSIQINPYTPVEKLLVRNTEQGWQLYDRDIQDRNSSTFMTLKGG